MSMTANSDERDWIRAFQVKQMLSLERHHPIKKKVYLGIGVIGTATGSLFGTALVTVLAADPKLEILTAVSGCILACLGIKYWDTYKTSFQEEKTKIFEKYKPYQIIQGKDLSYLLQHSSDGFKYDILKKINSCQILNTMLHQSSEGLHIFFEKTYRQLPKPNTSLDERIELEEKALNDLHDNVVESKACTVTLEKCREIFAEKLDLILTKFYSCHIKPENRIAIHNFAIKNKFLELSQYCDDYYDWYSMLYVPSDLNNLKPIQNT